MLSATVDAWGAISSATVDYWLGALSRQATPLDLAEDFMAWTSTIAGRRRPEWTHEHSIAREWPIARLRDFSTADADPDLVATVILPPQAGHDSSIVDFGPNQSQIVTGRENGCHRIYALEWLAATQETKDTTIDDYMALLRETADMLGGRINLIGDCQGGWVATIFAALHPEKVNTLTLAGAPIDFHAGEPLIHDWVKVLAPDGDMTFYRSVVDAHDGLLPGRFLLDGFNALQPDQELSRQVQLLSNIRDEHHVERYRQFEDWFQWTQPLPGAFFLWIVEHLFARNSLIKGELVVEGRTVDLAAISSPLFLMAGKRDHITPEDQVWALADYASTPDSRIGRQSSDGGHLGLFMSHTALENHWRQIFQEIAALSNLDPTDDPEVLTDEPTGKSSTPRASAPTTARTQSGASTTRKASTAKSSTTESTGSTTRKASPAKSSTTKSTASTTRKTSPAKSSTTKSTASTPRKASTAKSSTTKSTASTTRKAPTRQASTTKSSEPSAAAGSSTGSAASTKQSETAAQESGRKPTTDKTNASST